MDLDRLEGDRSTAVFGVSTSGAVATLPARPAPAHPPAALDPESLVPWDPNGEFAWMGTGVLPNAQDTERAIEVISAVPLAAAVGWSVRGHQWTTHPRRLRTAVVSPSKTWDIEVMRGVREVDGLSGRILVRMRAYAAGRTPGLKTPGYYTRTPKGGSRRVYAYALRKPALAGVTGRAGSCLPPHGGSPAAGRRRTAGGLRVARSGQAPRLAPRPASQSGGFPRRTSGQAPPQPKGAGACRLRSPILSILLILSSSSSSSSSPSFAQREGRPPRGPAL